MTFMLKRKTVITMRTCRAIAVVTVAAGPLLLTGCVNTANDWSTQTSQSIADGLSSAISDNLLFQGNNLARGGTELGEVIHGSSPASCRLPRNCW